MAQSMAAEQMLSTGLDSLDDALKDGGLLPGTMLSVVSKPVSLGDLLVYNMLANRPAYYFTLGRTEDNLNDVLLDTNPIGEGDITYVDLEDEAEPLRTAEEKLGEFDIDEPSTIVFDPVNRLENQESTKYQTLLRKLEVVVSETDSLGIVHCVETDQNPGGRWQTLHMSDTVIRLKHETDSTNVKDYLSVAKLHPKQDLRADQKRVFQLPRSLKLDVDTKENITP